MLVDVLVLLAFPALYATIVVLGVEPFSWVSAACIVGATGAGAGAGYSWLRADVIGRRR